MALTRYFKLGESFLGWRTILRRAFATAGAIDPVKTPKFEKEPWERLRETFEDDKKQNLVIPAFKRALFYPERIAIKDPIGEFTYFQLYLSAKRLSVQLSNICGSGACRNIALFCPNNFLSPLAHWTCWISGQVAMPLNVEHPIELLQYQIKEAKSNVIIATPEYEALANNITKNLNTAVLVIDHPFVPPPEIVKTELDKQLLTAAERIVVEGTLNNDFYTTSNALLLYTPGTMGKPKGVVLTHKNIDAQINCINESYEVTAKDCLLHVLSLQFFYGSIATLMAPLDVGAKVLMHDQFNCHNVWNTLLGINIPTKERPSVFMAIPAVYKELITEYDKIFVTNKRMVEHIQSHCEKNIRLMTCGSMSLSANLFKRWYDITGHKLIEHYGMTECGIVLSNPYVEDELRQRCCNSVGLPLPGTSVRLLDAERKPLLTYEGSSKKGYWAPAEKTRNIPVKARKRSTRLPQKKGNDLAMAGGTEQAEGSPFVTTNSTILSPIVGELAISGEQVFKEYSNEKLITSVAFVDGYFRSGDIAVFEDGVFKILGRCKKPRDEQLLLAPAVAEPSNEATEIEFQRSSIPD